MNWKDMPVNDIIKHLYDEVKKGHIYTIDELNKIVESVSVEDKISNKNAITILYSGGEDDIVNSIAATDTPNIRILRRTDLFKLLSSQSGDGLIGFSDLVKFALEDKYPEYSDLKIKEVVNKHMFGTSESNTDLNDSATKGYWTIGSVRFVRETQGDVYSLCFDAANDRIFAMDELKNTIDVIDNDKKINGVLRSVLLSLNGDERFDMVKNAALQDFKSAKLFVEVANNNGEVSIKKVGRQFSNTPLEKFIEDIRPDGNYLEINSSDYSVMGYNNFLNELKKSDIKIDSDRIVDINFSGTKLAGIAKFLSNSLSNSISFSFQNSKLNDSDNMLETMGNDVNTYVKFLKFKGTMYKQTPKVALDFFVQNSDIKYLATETQWKNIGCSIKPDEKAVKGIDKDGNQHNLYDISQVDNLDVNSLPKVWKVDSSNVSELKNKLGIDENSSLLNGVVRDNIQKDNIVDCAKKLNIAKTQIKDFALEYTDGVKCIVAGRLEFGGNKITDFSTTNDIFRSLDLENKMEFLSSVSQNASQALYYVESVVQNLSNEIDQTNNLDDVVDNSIIDKADEVEFKESIDDMIDDIDDDYGIGSR